MNRNCNYSGIGIGPSLVHLCTTNGIDKSSRVLSAMSRACSGYPNIRSSGCLLQPMDIPSSGCRGGGIRTSSGDIRPAVHWWHRALQRSFCHSRTGPPQPIFDERLGSCLANQLLISACIRRTALSAVVLLD